MNKSRDILFILKRQMLPVEERKPGSLIATWVTFNNTNESTVEYGEGNLVRSKSGYRTKFVDSGPQKRELYIHRVILDDLEPGKTYRKF
uniref:Purple acid phosphatase N-terminal domain-containing protein n=1 Tax=Romanomermis culicivorax TaxID=13658 RepID=A0A915K6E1_ROMCU